MTVNSLLGPSLASQYELLDLRYEDESAKMYLAWDIQSGQQVFIQFFQTQTLSDAERQTHQLQLQRQQSCSHANIVPVLNIETWEGGDALILPFESGLSLRYFCQEQSLDLSDIIELMLQLLDLLTDLAQSNFYPQQIHPSHFLIQPESGKLKLIDYNWIHLPKSAGVEEGSTTSRASIKNLVSPKYPPLDRNPIDFFGLGELLYQLLTQQTLEHASEPLERFHCHQQSLASLHHPLQGKVPNYLAAIAFKLILPTHRYIDHQTCRQDLEYAQSKLRHGGDLETFYLSNWQDDYSPTLRLHNLMTEFASSQDDIHELQKIVQIIQQQTQSLSEQIPSLCLYLHDLIAIQDYSEAIAVGEAMLKRLGIAYLDEDLLHTLPKLVKQIEQLESCPTQASKTQHEYYTPNTIQLLNSLLPALQKSAAPRYGLYAAKAIEVGLTLALYPSSELALSYSYYAEFCFNHCHQLSTAQYFTTRASQAIPQKDHSMSWGDLSLFHGIYLNHRTQGITSSLKILDEAHCQGITIGDGTLAQEAADQYCFYALWAGHNLKDLASKCLQYKTTLSSTSQDLNSIIAQVAANLETGHQLPWVLEGIAPEESSGTPLNKPETVHASRLCQFFLAVLFEQWEQALILYNTLSQHAIGTPGSYAQPSFYFYSSLLLSVLIQDASSHCQWMPQILDYQKTLQQDWGQAEHHHKWLLIEAEIARIEGNRAVALDLYDQAIHHAKTQDCLHEAALANERAAGFYRDWGKKDLAHSYLKEAYQNYQTWGAEAKARQLIDRFPTLVSASNYGTIAQQTLSLSPLMEPEILLSKLSHYLLNQSPAHLCGMILPHKISDWQIHSVTQRQMENPTITLVPPPYDLPKPLLQQVWEQKAAIAIQSIDNANSHFFLADQQDYPLSNIICLPLLVQEDLLGAVYLESRPTHPFTTEQCWKIEHLCQQGAIALHNAQQLSQAASAEPISNIDTRTSASHEHSSSATKQQFLAQMSHELRTPLNGILGYTQILERSPNLTARELEGVHIIHQCGTHLLSLIDNILQLAKLEAKKVTSDLVTIELPTFLTEIVDLCKPKAEEKGLVFHYHEDSKLPPGIRGDAKALRQVLLHLLDNAIKFTQTGSIQLSVKLKTEGSQSALHFAIADSGIGMAPQEQDQLFTLFEQLSHPHEDIDGLGIGLPISKNLVELMGGEIQVNSTRGKGSTFSFHCPCEVVEDISAIALNTPSPSQEIIGYAGERRHILLIDDRWENRSVLHNLLKSLDFKVSEAANGAQGLKLIRQLNPDLTITDFAMPQMSGYELLERVRSTASLRHHKIFVTSTAVNPGERLMAYDAGGDEFLTRPIEIEPLLSALEEHLSLTWCYRPQEDIPTPNIIPNPNPVAIHLPPIPIIQELLGLAQTGQLVKICHHLEHLKSSHPEYQNFIDPLWQFAKAFDIESLETRLNECLSQAKAPRTL